MSGAPMLRAQVTVAGLVRRVETRYDGSALLEIVCDPRESFALVHGPEGFDRIEVLEGILYVANLAWIGLGSVDCAERGALKFACDWPALPPRPTVLEFRGSGPKA